MFESRLLSLRPDPKRMRLIKKARQADVALPPPKSGRSRRTSIADVGTNFFAERLVRHDLSSVCSKPMTRSGKLFVCEPCRDFVIVPSPTYKLPLLVAPSMMRFILGMARAASGSPEDEALLIFARSADVPCGG